MSSLKTILIVDDEIDVLEPTGEVLTRMGFEVKTANSGSKALTVYNDQYKGIDLVLLDMAMPEMSAVDLYPRLKQINPEIRVLLYSGNPGDPNVRRLLESGCSGFIQKPFSYKALVAEIEKILNPKS